jgi:hypothetical protein
MPKNNDVSRGRFEGKVLEKLDGLDKKMDDMKADFTDHKKAIYVRVDKNSLDIAKQKGWVAGIALTASAVGAFLGSYFGWSK